MDSTNPVDLAGQQRERQRDALVAFEDALSSAGPRRAAAWAEGVHAFCASKRVQHHGDFTEQEDFYTIHPRGRARLAWRRSASPGHNELAIALPTPHSVGVQTPPTRLLAPAVTIAAAGRLVRHASGAAISSQAYSEAAAATGSHSRLVR